MNLWYAKAVILAANIMLIAIRAPHGQRSRTVPSIAHRRGVLEIILMGMMLIGFFITLIWVFWPVFPFADFQLRLVPLFAGAVCFTVGLWLFYRSHADLGTNWSMTLEVREQHQLITQGVYRFIRHPMYTSLFLYSIGQLFVLPNWVVGPSYLVTFGILFIGRIAAEERLMLEHFGDEYKVYMTQTKRLVPGVW